MSFAMGDYKDSVLQETETDAKTVDAVATVDRLYSLTHYTCIHYVSCETEDTPHGLLYEVFREHVELDEYATASSAYVYDGDLKAIVQVFVDAVLRVNRTLGGPFLVCETVVSAIQSLLNGHIDMHAFNITLAQAYMGEDAFMLQQDLHEAPKQAPFCERFADALLESPESAGASANIELLCNEFCYEKQPSKYTGVIVICTTLYLMHASMYFDDDLGQHRDDAHTIEFVAQFREHFAIIADFLNTSLQDVTIIKNLIICTFERAKLARHFARNEKPDLIIQRLFN
jgi:hypothetical protein